MITMMVMLYNDTHIKTSTCLWGVESGSSSSRRILRKGIRLTRGDMEG